MLGGLLHPSHLHYCGQRRDFLLAKIIILFFNMGLFLPTTKKGVRGLWVRVFGMHTSYRDVEVWGGR